MLRQLLPVAVHKLKAVLEKCICTVWMKCLGTASIPADWQLHLLPPLPSAVGRTSAMRLGKEIGCTMRVGRRVLYDTRKADQYFNNLTGVK